MIQAVVLAEMDGLNTPNAYGELPLIGLDPEKPNEKYFEHVDFIVNQAQELGLFVGMLPTWGDKVTPEHGGGPVIFTPGNAKKYGEFLGNRYKNNTIIWILGGDRNVTNDTVFAVWEVMAEGLRNGDGGRHLITYHPRGSASSSYWFHNEEWLDFNMYQSSHAKRFNQVYDFAVHDYLLHPAKPFVDGEPAYEDIPVEFWKYCDWSDPLRVPAEVLDSNLLISDRSYFKQGFFTGYDVRVHAYWNLLSGACGYTYGNNAIWQMVEKKGSFSIPCLYDWRESMDRPGAQSIRHIRALFGSRSFADLIPEQSVVYGFNPGDENMVRSAVAVDGSFLLVYMARGQKTTIVTAKIKDEINGWWFNPRTGEAIAIETPINPVRQEFIPPSSGIDNDWLLVLDGKSGGYKAPGGGMQ